MRSLPASVLLLAAVGVSAAQDKGTEVKVGGLRATAPADWKSEKPANLLRSYQFRLPAAKDLPGAEVAVFPESHPSPEKNFPKWLGQWVPPEGKTADDIGKTAKWDVRGATVSVLDISGGTWRYKAAPNDPKAKEMLLDDHRVVWVIVAEKDEATHIRLSGPKPSVDAQFKAFEAWVKGLK